MPEDIFRELADNAPVMIWRSSPDKLCDWFNRPWLEFTGRTMEQEVGYGWADGVHKDDFDRCVAIYTEAFDRREAFSMTYRLRRHDGAFRWILDNGAPFSRGGAFAGYFGSCIDVHDQQEGNACLVAALDQRDALIREVYHRVKNNLQQVEGLIAIEALALHDQKSRAALESISARVRAMGAVHQLLIRSKDFSHVRADALLSELCADIARAHGVENRGIVLEVSADPLELDIDRALIIGLLVNELTTNALKHGFPDGRMGRIDVRFGRNGNSGTMLEVADSGVGMPDGALPHDSLRAGFRLVRGFADQLDGEVTLGPGPGAVVRVVMP